MSPKLWQAVWALFVLLVGVGGAVGFVLTQPTTPREDKPVLAPSVRVIRVGLENVRMTLTGYGEVRAQVRSAIVPQVSGRVVGMHPGLQAGGLVPAGEPLLEIDRTDYELSLRSAESGVATAHAEVKAAEARIAEARVNANDLQTDLEKTLELHKSQVASDREVDKARAAYEAAAAKQVSAEADKASAEAQHAVALATLEQAGVHLSRTALTLPFDAVVVEKNVDLGQFVRDGQAVGEAYGVKAVEIAVPVADKELAWLESLPLGPLASAGGPYAEAEVESNFAGKQCTWQGVVRRTEGMVDRRSRMIKLVVEVTDPFDVEGTSRPPLMPGSFVKATIQGKELEAVCVLPRQALREGDVVWCVRDGRLHVASVTVARLDRTHAYITEGLEEGERVVVTPLEPATQGMAVRVVEGVGDAR